MALSYNKLWKLLIDMGKNKTYLRTNGIHPSTIAKMGKNEPVEMTVLMRICDLLKCSLDDIVEYLPESTQ